jgi:hypothetical protein
MDPRIISLRVARMTVFLFALSFFWSPGVVNGQAVGVAEARLTLRSGPSSQSRRLAIVETGDTLQLEPTSKRNNYYRISSHEHSVGWVWAARVRIVATGESGIATAESTSRVAGLSTPGFSGWSRPPVREVQSSTCPAVGRGSTRVDSTTDLLKNRVDIPSEYHALTVSQILGLPDTGLPTRRYRWTLADSAAVAQYEGAPIVVEGYLADAVEEGPEATNCEQDTPAWHDWHVWLVATEQEAISRAKASAVVVEVTPRVRALPMAWVLADLKAIHRAHERVRVGGWLMLDPDHPTNIGTSRGTIWEIHPVTHVEVFRNGAWVNLDQ